MKTIILTLLLAASTIHAQSKYHQLLGFIDVTSANQSDYDMNLSVIHRTDDYGNPRDTDQRHISAKVPLIIGDLKLESLRLMVDDPGPELTVDLAYSEEGLYASVDFIMAFPLLKTGVLFATYKNPDDENGGAGYCFELIKYEVEIIKPSEQGVAGYPPQGVGSPER
jgi:hypothetical protein